MKIVKKILVIILLIFALLYDGMSIASILYGGYGGKPIHYIILIISLIVTVICSLLIEKLFRKK